MTIKPNMVSLVFHSNLVLILHKVPQNEFLNGVLDEKQMINKKLLEQTYGKDAVQSEYALHKVILSTTPRNLTLAMPSDKLALVNEILIVKRLSTLSQADKGIFWVNTKDFKGFQYGTPGVHADTYNELFSDSQTVELIMSSNARGCSASYSQADLNRILQTLHRVPDTTLAASAAK